MKTVGIIGGLGPHTTANFYMKIILSCAEQNKIERPSILIYNVPITFVLEKNFILKGDTDENIIPLLINAAQSLEKGGADFIVIPCNTVHIFIDEVRKSINIRVLSIVEETTSFLRTKHINEVGLLATPTTIKNKLYDSLLFEKGIKTEIPNKSQISVMAKIINNLVNNVSNKTDKNNFMEIINSLEKKGVNSFLLACTDLQILNPKKRNLQIFDTMEILANSTVRELLSNQNQKKC